MSENQNKPEENLPDKEQLPIPGAQLPSSLTTQPQQPMEVHHHGHVHEKKKWKEYVFQFLMLFLAVFLGFLAENWREKGVERHMEEEYMQSLLKDAANDSLISGALAADIFTQVKGIDSLQSSLSELYDPASPNKDSVVKRCYRMTRYVQLFYPYFFNESTITQLLSSGNMRLIKKEDVADVIMEYHGFIKFVEVQKQLYINSVNDCIKSMYNLYDISFLQTYIVSDSFYMVPLDSFKIKPTLFAKSTDEIKKFNAMLETTKVVANTYRNYLFQLRSKGHLVYNFLLNTYHLEEI